MVTFSSWTLTVQCSKILLSHDSAGPASRGWGQPCGVTRSPKCSQEDRKAKGVVGRLHFLA